jgi:hypothetical protein
VEGDEAEFYCDRLVEVSKECLEMSPWLNVGLIKFVGKDGHGTGTLVSPNLVLTCGHNIFNKKFGKHQHDSAKDYFIEKFCFYPGHSGELREGYEVESYFLPEEFPGHPKEAKYDYALLKLKSRVPCTKFTPLCFDY